MGPALYLVMTNEQYAQLVQDIETLKLDAARSPKGGRRAHLLGLHIASMTRRVEAADRGN